MAAASTMCGCQERLTRAPRIVAMYKHLITYLLLHNLTPQCASPRRIMPIQTAAMMCWHRARHSVLTTTLAVFTPMTPPSHCSSVIHDWSGSGATHPTATDQECIYRVQQCTSLSSHIPPSWSIPASISKLVVKQAVSPPSWSPDLPFHQENRLMG